MSSNPQKLVIELDNSTRAELSNLIELEYLTIKDTIEYKQKAASYNFIIQTKKILGLSTKNEIYVDIKNYIKYYILSTDESAFGYDDVLFDKISYNINLEDPSANLSLYKYTFRILKSNGHDEQAKTCQEQIIETTRQVLKKRNDWFSYIHRFYILTTQSRLSIVVSLLSSIIISTLFLLPAVSPSFECLQYDKARYTDSTLINNILNTISLMTGIDDNVKIHPVNIIGFIITLAGKGVFLLVIANILIKQLKSKSNLE